MCVCLFVCVYACAVCVRVLCVCLDFFLLSFSRRSLSRESTVFYNLVALLQLNRGNNAKRRRRSFGLRARGGLTTAGSLSLPPEARHRVEVAAPIKLTFTLSAALQIHLKARRSGDGDGGDGGGDGDWILDPNRVDSACDDSLSLFHFLFFFFSFQFNVEAKKRATDDTLEDYFFPKSRVRVLVTGNHIAPNAIESSYRITNGVVSSRCRGR